MYTYGLVPSLKELCPMVEHTFCVWYLWSNFSKEHKGEELKDAMYACVYTITEQQFQKCMMQVKSISGPAWKWLYKLDPKVWSRHAFTYHQEIV